jgi:TonB family protein
MMKYTAALVALTLTLAMVSAEAATRAEEYDNWVAQLNAEMKCIFFYPETARREGVESGDVRISFIVDRVGWVVATRVEVSSGNSALDEAALAQIQGASPLPAPPQGEMRRTFILTTKFINQKVKRPPHCRERQGPSIPAS